MNNEYTYEDFCHVYDTQRDIESMIEEQMDCLDRVYVNAAMMFAQAVKHEGLIKITGDASQYKLAEETFHNAAREYVKGLDSMYAGIEKKHGKSFELDCPEIYENWSDGLITTEELVNLVEAEYLEYMRDYGEAVHTA